LSVARNDHHKPHPSNLRLLRVLRGKNPSCSAPKLSRWSNWCCFQGRPCGKPVSGRRCCTVRSPRGLASQQGTAMLHGGSVAHERIACGASGDHQVGCCVV